MLGSVIPLQQRAAGREAAQRRHPFLVWPEDIVLWQGVVERGDMPSFPFPDLSAEPLPLSGWRLVRTHFVDSSGLGQEGEAALTVKQFVERLEPSLGYAVLEVGQFQVVIGEFERLNAVTHAV